jgi:hypothetical protein
MVRLTARGVDPALWKRLRIVAIHEETSVGELLNEAIAEWLRDHGWYEAEP